LSRRYRLRLYHGPGHSDDPRRHRQRDPVLIETTKDLFAKENEKGAVLGDVPLFLTPATGFGDDADSPPGPSFAIGSQVMFTYVVTNRGDLPLTDVAVTDNRIANLTPVLTPNTT